MQYLWLPLAVAGLIASIVTPGFAQGVPAHQSATLYTGALKADDFHCKAVNVGDKALHIGFAVLGDDGVPLTDTASPPMANPALPVLVNPGTEAELSISLAPAGDGYCKFTVFGTGDRDRVRAVLGAGFTRDIPGTNPPVPVFLFKSIEAH